MFRDVVAVAPIVVAVVTFGINWIRTRRWDQRVAYRDELARFVDDVHVAEVFSDEARAVAKQSGAYLSLELAETARHDAAVRARRATTGFGRSIFGFGVIVTLGSAFFIAAIFVGWSDRDQWTNVIGAVYFSVGTIGIVSAYIAHVRSLIRVRNETGELKRLRDEVVKATPLTAQDAKITRPQRRPGRS